MECLILVTAMLLAHKVLALTHASVSLDSLEMDLHVKVRYKVETDPTQDGTICSLIVVRGTIAVFENFGTIKYYNLPLNIL